MTDESDIYICGICKKEFEDFVTFLQHKSSFGVFKCKLCNLSYHDREDIQKHINTTHSNQKVDVAFTIPTKASIVNAQSEPSDSNESSKSGYAISVYTCRLCNRFTLVEKSMLHHLQVVHKIHVVPGSVELAALMLCSKPLDTTSIPKLTGNPVVVKTVTPPSISKPPIIYLTAGTQTKLSSVNISELASKDEKENSPKTDSDSLNNVEKNNIFGNWVELIDENSSSEQTGKKNNVPVPDNIDEAIIASAVESISKPEDDSTVEEASNDNKNTKMTSILKSSIVTYSKTKPVQQSTNDQENEPTEESQQVVCFDGGHDYTCVVEVKDENVEESIVEEQEDVILSTSESENKFLDTYDLSKHDDSTDIVEQVVPAEEVSVIVAPEASKMKVLKSPPKITYARVPSKQMQSKVLLNKIKPPKRSVNSNLPKPEIPSKLERKSDESEDEEEEDSVVLDDDPQPGLDGMYRCKTCKRAFARERQFKAHMNVHIMYGEHYLESPSSNRSTMSGDVKGAANSRKKQKMQ